MKNRINLMLISLGVLLVLASSTPLGTAGLWAMRVLGVAATVVLYVACNFCRKETNDDRHRQDKRSHSREKINA